MQFKLQSLLLTSLLILSPNLSACAPTALAPAPVNETPRTLRVFAAASLTEAFTETGRAFEASHPGVTLMFNFGGSQNLRTQIEQGASADVFTSANSREMGALVAGKFMQAGAPQVFLTNQLIVILPAENPARISSLQDLSRPGLKIVVAAEEVPAGKYARQMLDNLSDTFGADYKEKVLANVVSNEDNIKQVVAKVQLGEADAGIVYRSDALAVPELQTIPIPPDANVIAEYSIAPLAEAANPDLVEEFIAYILSPEGQRILEKWGFTPVTP